MYRQPHFRRGRAGEMAHLPVVQETTEPQEAEAKAAADRMNLSARRAASSSRFGVEQGYMSGESSRKLWTCPNIQVSGVSGTLKTERPGEGPVAWEFSEHMKTSYRCWSDIIWIP